jgi:cyanophycinase
MSQTGGRAAACFVGFYTDIPLVRSETCRMAGSETTLIAIGGGDLAGAPGVLDAIFTTVARKSEARLLILTVATSEVDGAYDKYNAIFRKRNVKHVDMVDVSRREDAFSEAGVKKIEAADILFFTGGDQLNITSLFGGSPMHDAMHERVASGVVVVGTSAGAAMMSGSMIGGGRSDSAPKAEGVQLGPGLDLIRDAVIDTHFSQRGRHGRLLTVVAHYPQLTGIGLDEKCAVIVKGRKMTVAGDGCVTIFEGKSVTHCDLPEREAGECLGILGVDLHVLPCGYTYDLDEHLPAPPEMSSAAA